MMDGKVSRFSQQYHAALRKHLEKQGRQSSSPEASGLGRRAMSIGLETLDLARIHEQALIALVLPSYSASARASMVNRAGHFFAEAITPLEKTHRTAQETNVRLGQLTQMLRRRTADLAASQRKCKQEIARRKAVEKALR